MRKSVHNRVRIQERRLMRLYSLWHETHQEDYEKQYLSLLGEILSKDPAFNPRHDFQAAF